MSPAPANLFRSVPDQFEENQDCGEQVKEEIEDDRQCSANAFLIAGPGH
jgi:hypothetical protein